MAELTQGKARKILRDGSVRGKKLTSAQRGFFGARAGGASLKRERAFFGHMTVPATNGVIKHVNQ